MWDLTVAGDHDFYVQAAGPALVHNCPMANVPNSVKNAISDIADGNGVRRLDPDGSPQVYEARGEPLAVQRRWAGSWEYEVPGTTGNNYRILCNPKYNSFGSTDNHYSRIIPYNPTS
jgi:hypothetical protein